MKKYSLAHTTIMYVSYALASGRDFKLRIVRTSLKENE